MTASRSTNDQPSRLLHVDSDFAGDPDDACALAMLLGWPGIEIAGVTTNLDADGGRAGCARYFLRTAGLDEVPVAAGASMSMTTGDRFGSTLGDARHWPVDVEPLPSCAGAASDLLDRNVERGATIVAIGALTNLAALETERPGRLAGVDVVVMGGWFALPPPGYPRWGPEMDFNIQCDTRAAEIVLGAADVTLVPLPVAIRAHLRAIHLDRLRAAGPIGRLLARQSEAHRDDNGFDELGRAHQSLPDDLVNFHWDPVTAAVAAGWPGAAVEERLLRTRLDGDILMFEVTATGRRTRVVVDIDVDRFDDLWLASVERLPGAAPIR